MAVDILDNYKTFVDFDFFDAKSLKVIDKEAIIPCFLMLDNNKNCFKLKSWEECFKVFFNFYCLNEENLKSLSRYINLPITFKDKSVVLLTDSVSKYSDNYKWLKIFDNVYIKIFYKNQKTNFLIFKKLVKLLDIKEFKLIGCNFNICTDEEYNKKLALIKKTYSKIKIKNSKYLISKINSAILSPLEKLINKIEKEFDDVLFLGDIYLNSEEESVLNQYMGIEINKLIINNEIKNVRSNKLFLVGLVRYSMKYYGLKGSNFWPFVKEEYGVEKLSPLHQKRIHDYFEEKIIKYGKPYYLSNENSIDNKNVDNITLHCFVSTPFANQFFDYLFDFWRLDLDRDFLNYSENIDQLIYEIKRKNHDVSSQELKRHTCMAFSENERGCKIRIRRLIKMIDDWFWKEKTKVNSNNRLYNLLSNWANLPDGKFLKEKERKEREGLKKGEKQFVQPFIKVDFNRKTAEILLPRQTLKDYEENDEVYWRVSNGNIFEINIPDILKVKSGYKSYESSVKIDIADIFEGFIIELYLKGKCIRKFDDIKESTFRFFKADGNMINYLNEGRYYCLSKNVDSMPRTTDNYEYVQHFDTAFSSEFDLKLGQIIILPNSKIMQIGKEIKEGLIGIQKIEGVYANVNGNVYSVYNNIPKLFLKIEEKELSSIGLKINDKFVKIGDCKHEKYGIVDNNSIGYMFDLSDFINKDDVYDISVNFVKKTKTSYNYHFVLLKDLTFNFIGAPYYFKDEACLYIKNLNNFVDCGDWNNNVYQFSFSEIENDRDDNVSNDRKYIGFKYLLLDKEIQLNFKIPVLFWKFDDSENEEWHSKKPNHIKKKALPKKIYFDINYKYEKISLYMEDEDDIELQMFNDKNRNYIYFDTSDVLNNLKYEDKKLYLKIDNRVEEFVNIVCKSKVNKSSVYYDFEKDCLIGDFDIDGDSEYCVTIECDGEIIVNDEPLVDGKIEYKCDNTFNEFSVKIYEIEDSVSFFDDPIRYLLWEGHLKPININNLNGKQLMFNLISDSRRIFSKIRLYNKYLIENLEKVKFSKELAEKIDRYEINDIRCTNVEELNKYTFYIGTMRKMSCGVLDLRKEYKVLIVFFDKNDLFNNGILCFSEGSYIDMYFDGKRKIIVDSEKGYSKFDRLISLYMCEYTYEFDVKE